MGAGSTGAAGAAAPVALLPGGAAGAEAAPAAWGQKLLLSQENMKKNSELGSEEAMLYD